MKRPHERWQPTAFGVVILASLSLCLLVSSCDGGSNDRSTRPPRADSKSTTTSKASVSTAASTVTTTTTSVPSTDRLSRASRLGFAGLGPVQLGMTLAEASQAAGTPLTTGTTGCNPTGIATADAIWPPAAGAPFVQFGVQDGRVVTIHVFDPQIETLSGIHIGSTDGEVLNTYPNAVVGRGVQLNRALRITNSDSREIVFYEDTYDTPGTVGVIELAINSDSENVGSC